MLIIPLILTFILVMAFILVYRYVPNWFYCITGALWMMPVGVRASTWKGMPVKGTGDAELDKTVEMAGYSYEQDQDLFYSIMNPWQRKLGYCRLYDEASALSGMIIDCEPIYFDYGRKKWMIEFWKGQYDMAMGCEVGVYTAEKPGLNIPGVFNGTFYNCASNADRLQISYTLKRNEEIIFTRKDKHWWLTGFKVGEFAEPAELTMEISITLKDWIMRNEFIKGLKNAGYSDDEIIKKGSATVNLTFGTPRTPQPFTRTEDTDWLMQVKNAALCNKYQDMTRGCTNIQDKIKAIQKQAPEILEQILNMGKPKQLNDIYETIKDYLNQKKV